MCNMIHVIAFLSSPSEFQTLCVHLASVSIVRIWYCGVSSWFWLDFLVLLTGPCPRSLPVLSLLSDPPTRCHRQPSNQALTLAKRFKSKELFIIIFLIDWRCQCLPWQAACWWHRAARKWFSRSEDQPGLLSRSPCCHCHCWGEIVSLYWLFLFFLMIESSSS